MGYLRFLRGLTWCGLKIISFQNVKSIDNEENAEMGIEDGIQTELKNELQPQNKDTETESETVRC